MTSNRVALISFGLLAAAAVAVPAQAVTFANYSAVDSNSNMSFTGATAGGALSANAETVFSFLTLDPSYTNLSAHYTFSGLSGVAPVSAYGVDIEPSLSGSFSFIYDGPTTSTLTAGENLLSGIFNGAKIVGADGGSTASFQDSILSGGMVSFSSSVVTFLATGDKGLALELTSVTPGLTIGRNGQLLDFTGVSTGSFAADISTGGGAGGVPEPATWAMMLVGFAGIGCARRSWLAAQRKAAV